MRMIDNKQDINLEDILTKALSAAPNPLVYQYFRGLAQRQILFNDEVDDDVVESVILPLLQFDNDGSGKPIELLVHTSGGDIYTGMAICDVIDNIKTPLTVKIVAGAMSMGAMLAMAGFNNNNVKTVCYPHAVFLIHDGSSYLSGSLGQVRDAYTFREKYEKLIDDYILTHSKIPKELYNKQKGHEWYLTAADALSYGIVDEVL